MFISALQYLHYLRPSGRVFSQVTLANSLSSDLPLRACVPQRLDSTSYCANSVQ